MGKFLLIVIYIFSLITGTVWASVIALAIYVAFYTGYEVFIVTVLFDGYMGAFFHIPWLSLWVGLIVIVVSIIKQKLLLYTDQNEMAT